MEAVGQVVSRALPHSQRRAAPSFRRSSQGLSSQKNLKAQQRGAASSHPNAVRLSSASRAAPVARPRAAAEAATVEEEVTIDNCTVLVVGEGPVGLEVMRRFAKAGSWVTALHTGETHRKEIEGLGAMLALGEAASAEKVARTLRGNSFDAVIYALDNESPDSLGAVDSQLNVIVAAREAKVPRFLLVSSAAAEDEESLARVEGNLREGGALHWTIIRTGPIAEKVSGPVSVTEDASAEPGAAAAADVALLVSQILFDSDFAGKVLKAVSIDK